MFMAGVNPFISNFFVIPLIILLVGLVYLKKKSSIKSPYSTSILFGISCILFLIWSTLIYTFWGNSAIDIQMHDTYYVIAHFHILVLISLVFGVYSIIYFVIRRLAKRELNKILSETHFWLSTICAFLLAYLMFNTSMDGVPRRYYSVETPNAYEYVRNINSIITITAATLFISQILFFVNLAYSFLKNSK